MRYLKAFRSTCKPVLEAEEPEEPAIADTYKQWLNEIDRIA